VKIPSTIATLLIGIGLTLLSLWVGQHHNLLPQDASIEANRIDAIFNAMMAIAVGLFVLVQGALLYAFFRFRRKPGDDTDAEPIEGNIPLEIVWTAIPTVIVLWLSIYSFDTYKAVASGGYIGGGHHMAHTQTDTRMTAQPGTAIAGGMPGASSAGTTLAELPPANAEQFEVNVNALQYAWIFNYPKTGVVSGELHLPVNQNVQLTMSANDVIHAFWVPEFRLKQDVLPAEKTYLNFTPTRTGSYPIICAELCGAYHGGMRTRVIVQTPEEFQQWQQSQIVAATESTVLAEGPTSDQQRLHAYADTFQLPEQMQDVKGMHHHHHAVPLPSKTTMVTAQLP
jgi:cytochrome c oxidase subunit II